MSFKKFTERELAFHKTYLRTAKEFSKLSYCVRAKVGCIIVKDKNIISYGYNGTPSGMENVCEFTNDNNELETKWYVLHAESNAILKIATNNSCSTTGADMYLTLSPCKECSKLILQSKIKRLFYIEEHYNVEGLEFLRNQGIETIQIKNI